MKFYTKWDKNLSWHGKQWGQHIQTQAHEKCRKLILFSNIFSNYHNKLFFHEE